MGGIVFFNLVGMVKLRFYYINSVEEHLPIRKRASFLLLCSVAAGIVSSCLSAVFFIAWDMFIRDMIEGFYTDTPQLTYKIKYLILLVIVYVLIKKFWHWFYLDDNNN